jgi:medium-chain acyl-[acyl-carrier-protein] hydrolase
MGLDHSKWLTPLNGFQGRVRLFVFPYAGGGAAAFRTWRDRLPAWISLQAIQLPGRESRFSEPPLSQWTEIAMPVTDVISRFDDAPVVLFGHSMGSILAFEVARDLRRRRSRPPSALIVSGRTAPQLIGRAPRIGHLEGRQLLGHLIELYGGIPHTALDEADLVDVMARVLKSDLSVVEGYRYLPEPPLDLPIAAFGGFDDLWVTAGELDAWREQTQGAFTARMFPGDHFYFRISESEGALLDQVRRICSSACGLV